jgi:hypothetical protein
LRHTKLAWQTVQWAMMTGVDQIDVLSMLQTHVESLSQSKDRITQLYALDGVAPLLQCIVGVQKNVDSRVRVERGKRVDELDILVQELMDEFC